MNTKNFYILMAIGAALRLLMINIPPLWYDENFTLLLSRLPFDKLIQATAGDVHPPLHYMVLWLIQSQLPELPAWWIRIPSFVFSVLSLWIFIQLVDETDIPERVALPAIVMMTILPMQLWYAQEGRMYALLEMLVLGALLLVVRGEYLRLALPFAMLLYTQNYGLFYVACISLVALAREDVYFRAQAFWRVAASGALAVLAYIPWALVLAGQMTTISGRYWITDASAGAALKTIYQQFWASAMLPSGIVPSYVLTFAALLAGTVALIRAKHPAASLILIMGYLPFALAWGASLVWQPLLLHRALIGTSPFFYLIVAWCAEYIPAGNVRRAAYAAALVIPLLMFGVGGYYLNIPAMKGEGAVSPLLDSLTYIRANWQEGDILYYTDDGPMINLMPYTDLPAYRMPECDIQKTSYAPVLGSLSDQTRAALGVPIAALDDIPHKRAWVFAPRSPLHPKCYEEQIAIIAPDGMQLITVDENEYLVSGIWLKQ